MNLNEPFHSYRELTHPLAQIDAAELLREYVEAFVSDEWHSFYRDEPPSEDEVEEAVDVMDMLGALRGTGLRFELADAGVDPGIDGYWSLEYGGSTKDILLHAWAFKVMDAIGLEARAFFEGLRGTNLVFVPDEEKAAERAYALYMESLADCKAVDERNAALEKERASLSKSNDGVRVRGHRGEGPREKGGVIADRVARAVRDAGRPVSPDDVAKIIRHKNVASVGTALHQVAAYGTPKRLAGWIVRGDDGRYHWAE